MPIDGDSTGVDPLVPGDDWVKGGVYDVEFYVPLISVSIAIPTNQVNTTVPTFGLLSSYGTSYIANYGLVTSAESYSSAGHFRLGQFGPRISYPLEISVSRVGAGVIISKSIHTVRQPRALEIDVLFTRRPRRDGDTIRNINDSDLVASKVFVTGYDNAAGTYGPAGFIVRGGANNRPGITDFSGMRFNATTGAFSIATGVLIQGNVPNQAQGAPAVPETGPLTLRDLVIQNIIF